MESINDNEGENQLSSVSSTSLSLSSLFSEGEETKKKNLKSSKNILTRIYIYEPTLGKINKINTNGNDKISTILRKLLITSNKYHLSTNLSKNKRIILSNDKTLNDYNIKNDTLFQLIHSQQNIIKNKQNLDVTPTLTSLPIQNFPHNICHNIKTKKHARKSGRKNRKKKDSKFNICCNFGVPYNKNKGVTVSYKNHLTLNDYEKVLKKTYEIIKNEEIIWEKSNKTILNTKRIKNIKMETLKNLQIKENDVLYAIVKPVNIQIISIFGERKGKMSLNMVKNFTINMLKEQIQKIFKINKNYQNLIYNGIVLNNDIKCKKVLNQSKIFLNQKCSECIHVKCSCMNHSLTLTSNKNNKNNTNNTNNKNININNNNNNNTDKLHVHYSYHPTIHSFNPHRYNIYRKKLNDFDGIDEYKFEDDDDDNITKNINESNNAHKSNIISWSAGNVDKLKICRYGRSCRYNNNPYISGPCRYYHPSNDIQQKHLSVHPWKTQATNPHFGIKRNKYNNNYNI